MFYQPDEHLNSFAENHLLSTGLENDKLLCSPLYSFFVIRQKTPDFLYNSLDHQENKNKFGEMELPLI